MTSNREFVEQNWRDKEALSTLLGKPGKCEAWNFGTVPTERAQITATGGVITQVKTWSGLNWSAKGGYGSPTCSVWGQPDIDHNTQVLVANDRGSRYVNRGYGGIWN